MELKLKSYNFNDFSLIYIVFFSIVYQSIVPIGFIFWIALIWVNTVSHPLKSITQLDRTEFWFIIYYLLLFIGMFWTDNLIFGLSKLENKLCFILFPVLFRISKFNLSLKSILSILIGGLFISLLVYEFIGLYKTLYYPEIANSSYFLGLNFTVYMHRGYYSMYLIIAICICIYRILNKDRLTTHLFLYFFFAIGSFQTLSKAGILCFVIIHVIYLLYILINNWKSINIKQLILLFSVSAIVIVFSVNTVIVRVNKTLHAIQNIKLENNNSVETNQARLIMWNTSLEVIHENFFLGTGTGDYNDELVKKNNHLKNYGVAKSELNSHNQFLNTFVQIGLLGFLALVLIFYSFFRAVIKKQKIVLLLIGICFFINFLFESFIETQSGIILFCILMTVSASSKLGLQTQK